MAYFEDRALRASHINPGVSPDFSRVAGIALIFALASALIVWLAPETGTAPLGEDWHGNVAASGFGS